MSIKSKRRQAEQQPAESFEAYGEYQYTYQPQEEAANAAEAAERARIAHAKRKNHLFFRFLLLLAIVTVGVVVAQQTLFRLETVYVIGNQEKTPQQVVIASGLARGQNMLNIEEADVARHMAEDHTLIFKGMQKEYPSTIHLYIEERKTTATMQWLGVLYKLDGQGMVMSIEKSGILPQGLPLVTGFLANNITVGQLISPRDMRQIEAYQAVIYELQQQLYGDQVSEINIVDPENIYLVTLEGVTARLGNAEWMEGKIGAVKTCMAYLRQLGKTNGVLDVSDVTDLQTAENEVKYMPED